MNEWRRSHGYFVGLIHAIFLLPAATVVNLQPDFMHIVDIGCALFVVGGALFELVYESRYFPGIHTVAERCDEVWRRISNQYASRGTPVQLGNLEPSFFSNTEAPHRNYPVLSTRVKAAETRQHSKTSRCAYQNSTSQ